MISRQLYPVEGVHLSKESLESQNLTGVLAWASEYNVSYESALKSLVSQSAPLVYRIPALIFTLGGTTLKRNRSDGFYRRSIVGVRLFYRSAIECAVTDLQDGYSLSNVLKRHLHWWLPEYYIESVRLGEENGCLKETLRQLSETTSKVTRRRKEIFSVIAYPFIVSFICLFILWGLAVFIIPKFKKIFDDLLEGEPFPVLTELVVDLADMLIPSSFLTIILIIQLPWLVYYCCCTHKFDWVLAKIPILRRPVLRWQKIDSIQALAVFTRMKFSLTQALDMICEYLPQSSLKNRFKRLNKELLNGNSLEQAWKSNFPGDYLGNFYVQSGLKTDKLPTCLDQYANELQNIDNRKHALFMKIIQPLILLIISLVIAIIVIGMFLPMIYIINKMAINS